MAGLLACLDGSKDDTTCRLHSCTISYISCPWLPWGKENEARRLCEIPRGMLLILCRQNLRVSRQARRKTDVAQHMLITGSGAAGLIYIYQDCRIRRGSTNSLVILRCSDGDRGSLSTARKNDHVGSR